MKECELENISRQLDFGYCNIHNLANALRDYDFTKLLDDEDFICGGNDSIDKALRLCGYHEWMVKQICMVDQYYGHFSSEFIYNVLSSQNESTKRLDDCTALNIYFLSVQLKEPHFHSTCAFNINGRIFYSDPYFDKFIEIESASDFDSLFIKCVDISRIYATIDGIDSWIVFDAEKMGVLKYL